MEPVLEYFSNVSNEGKLQKNVSEKIAQELIFFAGKRVEIKIKKLKSTRSDRQNRYYWGGVISSQIDCFIERWGEIYSKEQVHDWNKNNIWNTEKIDEGTGEIFKIPGTSKVSVSEFETRLEQLRQFFELKFEWRIPLPNEQLELIEQ